MRFPSAPASRCRRRSTWRRATARERSARSHLRRFRSFAASARSASGKRWSWLPGGGRADLRAPRELLAKESLTSSVPAPAGLCQARAEQNRYLERAADRAYPAMHALVAPLLAVLVLLLAYGFLRFLAQTV